MSAVINQKLGSSLISLLQFTADEWSTIDFNETPVIGKVKQGETELDCIIGYDYETFTVTISVDLVEPLTTGQAQFDVWIGDRAIPVGYNIRINLIKGVAV